MLTFRNTNITFIALGLSAVGYDWLFTFPVYLYIIGAVVYSLILFYGCYYVGSNFFIKIICSADTVKKEIALSFDDGPATSYTPAILQVLREHRVEAAFFCIGRRIAGHESLLRQLADEGHLIGNHSYSHHFLFDLFSTRKMLADLRLTDEAVKKATGFSPKLFRPPYGVTNPNVRNAIVCGHYTPVGWNIRSMDTVIKKGDDLFQRIARSVQPGAVILLHDTCAVTLHVLPRIIRHLHANGYEIVRLDKMLKLKPYA